MKTIPLTRGYFTKVDDEDYERFAPFRWYALVARSGIRAVRDKRYNGKRKTLHLSREILEAPSNRYVDHINGDTLDNQKQNLRLCSNIENACNSKLRKDNTSGYRGVHWAKHFDKWTAQIMVNQKMIHLGGFLSKEEAAKAYNKAARYYFGKFAQLNNI